MPQRFVSRDTVGSLLPSGKSVLAAISPRSNSLAVITSSREGSGPIRFVQWDDIPDSDVQFFAESYVTFKGLQEMAFRQEEEVIPLASTQSIEFCYRALRLYCDHVQDQLDRLAGGTPFNEEAYVHYAAVFSTLYLFRTIYTSASGSVDGLLGEELLDWLNHNYVAPSTEEGVALVELEKPWLDKNFWTYITRCVLRGISQSALRFISQLDQHPSHALRRLSAYLTSLITSHPRSTEFSTEHEFLSMHRRWAAGVKQLRQEIDLLEEWDGRATGPGGAGEGEWREGIELLCGIMEGKKEALFDICDREGWGWREALGAWGVWIDVRLNREEVSAVLPLILEALPLDSTNPDEPLQTTLISYDFINSISIAKDWDLWLAAHMTDMLDKLGELQNVEESRSASIQKDPDNPLSVRSTVLLEYAEHLHTDPSLWELTLEYMGACGNDAKDQMAEILKRVSIDVETKRGKRTAAAATGGEAEAEMVEDEEEGGEGEEAAMWERWSAKVDKIISVCKDYGLNEAIVSVCKSVAQVLVRNRAYGRAIPYCVMARDSRAVGRIADLLLEEYITKGADEFCKQVAAIPPQFLPTAGSLEGGINGTADIFTARLQFLSRYADFHAMYGRGEKKDAARFLVMLLSSGLVPRWWRGVVLLDAAGMLEDEELLITVDDAYELLRHLEEIYMRAEQGSAAEYLGALEKMMGGKPSAESDALGQLEVVRLALARYLARCSTVSGASEYGVDYY
ncbi:hypothetical protein BOTBODRAFT_171134 [Botryobasidium botryosum FD-172 SS1]|uniref:Nuclear pore complex protein Nup85 n=1 Tax=Botryobasidium botryosum (strain FD-172 SS1) TaxID=930990 RepID=A0A067N5Y1_BOTB1|nr:hypothetical protein BOTBODRAFT_171134 [Botryobasidium botryosum FD-172 SS1]